MAKKVKVYTFGSSIRSEGIGDVEFLIATTSMAKAIAKIRKHDPGRPSANWIRQRINIHETSLSTPYREHLKSFNPWSTPDVLYMFETSKMEGHHISYRRKPKLIKKWS